MSAQTTFRSEGLRVPDANDIPPGYWIASTLRDEDPRPPSLVGMIVCGKDARVYGDFIPQDELTALVDELREDAGLPAVGDDDQRDGDDREWDESYGARSIYATYGERYPRYGR